AVVRVLAHAHFFAPPHAHLEEPVRVREALSRRADDVAGTGGQALFRLAEALHAARHHHRRGEPCLADAGADAPRRFHVAPDGTSLVGDVAGHAFEAAGAGIGIGGPAHLRLLGIVELAAAGERQEIHAGAGELDAEVLRVFHVAAALDALVGEEAAAHAEVVPGLAAHAPVHLERQADA